MSKSDQPLNVDNLEKQTRIKLSHLLKIAEQAVANDNPIIIRPVNEAVVRQFKERDAVGKGMDVKGKSTDQGQEVGLDGLITFDQELSKLGTINDVNAIKIYNEKNETKIKQDQARYDKIKNTDLSKLSGAEMIEFEESLKNLVETIPFKDKNGHDVVYFKDQDSGRPLKGENNQAVFAIKKNNELYLPNKNTPYKPPANYQEKPVEVLGYRRLSVKGQELVEEKSTAITADYDQLAVFTRAENRGQAKPMKDMPNVGFATDIGHVVTTVLAKDTEDNLAISHGQETGNPVPEKINKDVYPLFEPTPEIIEKSWQLSQAIREETNPEKKNDLNKQLDDVLLSSVKILTNEQDIVDLYNKKEAQGYQAPVNTGWGWKRDDNNKYMIDHDRALAQDIAQEIHHFNGQENLQPAIKAMSNTYQQILQEKLEPNSQQKDSNIAKLEEKLQTQSREFRKETGHLSPIDAAKNKYQKNIQQAVEVNNIKKYTNLASAMSARINKVVKSESFKKIMSQYDKSQVETKVNNTEINQKRKKKSMSR